MNSKGLFIVLMIMSLLCCPDVKAISDIDYITAAENHLFAAQYKTESVAVRLNRLEKNVFGKTNPKETTQKRVQKLKSALGSFNQVNPQPVQPQKTASIPKTIPKISASSPSKGALEQYPIIDEIEVKIFNKKYSNENIYIRLERLETTLFNRRFDDSLSNRTERLKISVLGSQNNTAVSNNESGSNSSISSTNNDSINMVLGQLEKETFKTTYEHDTVDSRLDRLEKQIFNQTSPEDDADSRLERLAAVITAQPSSELYTDMSKLRQYQNVSTGVTAAALIMLLIKGLLF